MIIGDTSGGGGGPIIIKVIITSKDKDYGSNLGGGDSQSASVREVVQTITKYGASIGIWSPELAVLFGSES